jgi:hypothetical protein
LAHRANSSLPSNSSSKRLKERIMERIVLELDGVALDGGARAAVAIEELLDACDDPLVAVVPAFGGVADILEESADGGGKRGSAEAAVSRLREGHLAIAEAMEAPAAASFAAGLRIEVLLRRLLSLLSAGGKGERAEILAAGARLSATCVALAFAALGRPAPIVEPKELGLVGRGGREDPRVDLVAAGPIIRSALGRFPCAVGPGESEGAAAILASALGARHRDAGAVRALARARLAFSPFPRGAPERAPIARAAIAQKPGVA